MSNRVKIDKGVFVRIEGPLICRQWNRGKRGRYLGECGQNRIEESFVIQYVCGPYLRLSNEKRTIIIDVREVQIVPAQ